MQRMFVDEYMEESFDDVTFEKLNNSQMYPIQHQYNKCNINTTYLQLSHTLLILSHLNNSFLGHFSAIASSTRSSHSHRRSFSFPFYLSLSLSIALFNLPVEHRNNLPFVGTDRPLTISNDITNLVHLCLFKTFTDVVELCLHLSVMTDEIDKQVTRLHRVVCKTKMLTGVSSVF